MMVRYIAMDLESGGIPQGCSVLSAFFSVLDENMKPLKTLSLKVKPNDPIYHVTAEALEVNGIDLIEHDKIAIPYSKAGGLLRDFLIEMSISGQTKLIPLGKNVNGDIKWITESILGAKTWNIYVSYRVWEVTTLALACQRMGKMPYDMSISLGSLVKYFKITGIAGKIHEEEYDTLATVAVSEALLKLMAS